MMAGAFLRPRLPSVPTENCLGSLKALACTWQVAQDMVHVGQGPFRRTKPVQGPPSTVSGEVPWTTGM